MSLNEKSILAPIHNFEMTHSYWRKIFEIFFSFSKIQCDKVQDVKPEVLYKAESDSNHSDSVKSEASSTNSRPRGVDPNPPKPGYGRGRGRGRGRAALQEIL